MYIYMIIVIRSNAGHCGGECHAESMSACYIKRKFIVVECQFFSDKVRM